MLETMRTITIPVALFAAIAIAGIGCDGDKKDPTPTAEAPQPTEAPAEEKAAEKPKTANPADKAAEVPAAGGDISAQCKSYQDELCKIAGDPSYYCTAFKTTLPVMPDSACTAGLKDLAASTAKLKGARKTCDSLVEKLCNDLGKDSETCGLVRSKTPEFPTDQCAQMQSDYGNVLSSLKAEDAKNKPLTAVQRTLIEGGDPAAHGPKNAKVTVVEFSDFECPYCSQAADATTKLKEKYPKDVRIIFRHFPLSFHKQAHLASQASMAANDQGKFWEYHDLIFLNQKALSRADLESHAQKLNLNMKKFKAALDAETHKQFVDTDLEMGTQVGVNGTPTMFINGRRVQNPTDVAGLSRMIDSELAK